MRKLTYTPVWCGSRADQKARTHSRSSSKPSADSVMPVMLKVWPPWRPVKAVSASGTRVTAPPICQIGKAVRGERMRNEWSTAMSMTSSVSSATSQERM